MRTRAYRVVAAVLALLLVAAACGSSDTTEDSEDTGTDSESADDTGDTDDTTDGGDDTTDDTADGGDDTTDDTAEGGDDTDDTTSGATDEATDTALRDGYIAQLAELAASPETMFPCADGDGGTPTASARGVTEDEIEIAFLNADLTTLLTLNVVVPLGPEYDNFVAVTDYVNETCGGVNGRRLNVTEYVYDAINGQEMQQVCTEVTQEKETFLVVTRIFPLGQLLCITEANEHLAFYVGARPTEFYERSGGRLFSQRMDETRSLAIEIVDLNNSGLIGPDSPVGLIWGDAAETNAIAADVLPLFDELGIEVVDIQLTQAGITCEGYTNAVETMRGEGVETVLSILSATCYPGLVAEAAAQGWFPQWVATDWSSSTGDAGAQRMVDSGDAFDGAIGISPTVIGASEGEGYEPPVFDQACLDFLNERVGTSWAYPDPEFSAAGDICTSAISIVKGLQGAGTDLTQESFITAMGQVTDVPQRNNVVGSFAPDRPYPVPDIAHTVRWSIDCVCWITIDGPRRVELPE